MSFALRRGLDTMRARRSLGPIPFKFTGKIDKVTIELKEKTASEQITKRGRSKEGAVRLTLICIEEQKLLEEKDQRNNAATG
jgi:hypothetical protein